jgi:hypothetical protein
MNKKNELVENESAEENPQTDSLEKTKKIEEERNALMDRVINNIQQSSHDKIAYILHKIPKTRNSDIELAWNYWRIFESDKWNLINLKRDELNKLTKISTISRIRARIQNTYGLFQPDLETKKHRLKREEEMRETAIEDDCNGIQEMSLFIDETGKVKGDKIISVGGLWVIDTQNMILSFNAFLKWKMDHKITREFHFRDLNKGNLELYKDFIKLIFAFNPTISFKMVSIFKEGFKSDYDPIEFLTYKLIVDGVKEDLQNGRYTLPRQLYVLFDEEHPGPDTKKAEEILSLIKRENFNGLYLPKGLESGDSKKSFLLQATDLIIAALNRKLNPKDDLSNEPKNEFVNFIIELLEFENDIKNLLASSGDFSSYKFLNCNREFGFKE